MIAKKEKVLVDDGAWGRRTVLRGAALLAGAAATAPLLGGAATARARGADADALFKAGEFDQAARNITADFTDMNLYITRGKAA
ncbi:hypothetical protein [Nonomuraea sp. B5E05]|uniref:hypothetical protein n=1 Tax=Nonomuraea sp. B5E05 TaxID=3153569 RepID=UPI00325FFCE4